MFGPWSSHKTINFNYGFIFRLFPGRTFYYIRCSATPVPISKVVASMGCQRCASHCPLTVVFMKGNVLL